MPSKEPLKNTDSPQKAPEKKLPELPVEKPEKVSPPVESPKSPEPVKPDLPEIFFATENPKKLKEVKAILEGKFIVKSFEDLKEKLEVEETESTLKGNALLKANAFFKVAGIPTFADDTGLEVASLDGAPGVFSARYAGPEADGKKNTEKLMLELRSKTDRTAAFRTVIAYVNGEVSKTFEGILKGEISIIAAGKNGFGYDPVFLPEQDDRTLAEFEDAEKNKISHRARALNKFVKFLLK